MNWRRVTAAWLDCLGYMATLLAEEVDPPPPRKVRVRQPKIAKPSWYTDNH